LKIRKKYCKEQYANGVPSSPLCLFFQNLTEYNTALNRRIPVIPISLEDARRKKRQRGNRKQSLILACFLKKKFPHFDVIIIFIARKPHFFISEDIDPTVGRFRNLVATAIISSKRKGSDEEAEKSNKEAVLHKFCRFSRPMVSSLSIVMNAAPDLELYAKSLPEPTSGHVGPFVQGIHRIRDDEDGDAPHKKKYAKESWPGRKPNQSRVLA
uniref:Brix domain-containing protein n=1 Tax=Gongylonema pulchrum TaxID=637853 RepID=A0A183EYC2_9BILA